MPRPSPYSRTRRLVMQATMAGVLLVTVGAAALLARVREQRWAVTLVPAPHLTERLAMRMPRGWRVEESLPGEGPLTVTATQQRGGRDEVRVLEVVQFPTDMSDPGTLLGGYLSRVPGAAGAGEAFGFLGQPGVMTRFLFQQRHPLAPELVVEEEPQWYAATVLPGATEGGGKLAVVLHLRGPAAGGPSGSNVLRQVAAGMAVRDVGATRPAADGDGER